MSSIIKVNEIQDGGGNTILSSDGSGTVTQTRTGITNVQSFQLTADTLMNGNPSFVTSNIGSNSSNTYADKGTIVSQSSGVFSFSATGYYQVSFSAMIDASTTPDTFSVEIQTTNDNSTYNIAAMQTCEVPSGSNDKDPVYITAFVNVDDTTNVKVKFSLGQDNGVSSTYLRGNASQPETVFNFIRLGDSV